VLCASAALRFRGIFRAQSKRREGIVGFAAGRTLTLMQNAPLPLCDWVYFATPSRAKSCWRTEEKGNRTSLSFAARVLQHQTRSEERSTPSTYSHRLMSRCRSGSACVATHRIRF